MKKNIMRMLLAVVLGIVSMSAWADNRVVIATLSNGAVTVGAVPASGEQTVTLTVTPAANYYIEASDIVVNKTVDAAQAQRRAGININYAEKLAVTAVSVDGTGKGTYRFTLPDGYGAYVEATFTACIAIAPTVTITGWTYGAYNATTNAPKVAGNTGNGAVTYTYATKGATTFGTAVPTDAGEYTVKASIAAAGHYLAGEATTNFTIAKAAATISFASASMSKTFGDAAFTNALTNTGDGAVSYTSSDAKVATVDGTGKVTLVGSGTATITATVTDGKNYTYATKTATYPLEVKAATMSVTANGYEGTYDGKAHGISVTAPSGATVKYGTAEGTYTLDASPTYADAGTYTVYYQVTKASFTAVKGSQTVVIKKAAATISFATTSMSKTFGDAAFTNALANTGDGAVSYTSSDAKVATVNATTGEVTVIANGFATITATVTDGKNYTYATKTATFILGVGMAVMSVTATGYEGTYDQTAHGISVSAPSGATVKYGTAEGIYTLDASPTYTDAGTYTVYYEVTMAGYVTVQNSATVSIAQAAGAISYATASISKTYGDAAFTNPLTLTGDGTVTYASSDEAVATVNATTGEVTIVGGGTTTITATVVDGKNYAYATKTAAYTLEVGAAGMSVTATGYEGVYDETAHGISVSAPEGAVVKYGMAEGVYTLDASPTYTDAGTYTVYYEVTKTNFTAVEGSQTVVIKSAEGSISYATASISKTLGDAAFTNALTITGDGTVTYASSDEAVATVNATTGEVTIVGGGSATITATVTDGTNYTYAIKTAEYALAVLDKTALYAAYSDASAYYESIKDQYPDIAAALKESLDEIEHLLQEGDAAQAEVDAAVQGLTTAVQTAQEEVAVITGISDALHLNDDAEMMDDVWYDLNGRRLRCRPTTKGIYVKNGKKVMVK